MRNKFGLKPGQIYKTTDETYLSYKLHPNDNGYGLNDSNHEWLSIPVKSTFVVLQVLEDEMNSNGTGKVESKVLYKSKVYYFAVRYGTIASLFDRIPLKKLSD